MVFSNNMLLGVSSATAAYLVEQSLLFDGASYLSRTPASAGNRKTWTFDCWVKRGSLGTAQTIFSARSDDNNRTNLYFSSNNQIGMFHQIGGSTSTSLLSTAAFSDTGGWYHFTFVFDSTPTTPGSSDCQIWVNGTQITDFSTETYPSQNDEPFVNASVAHSIGRSEFSSPTNYFSGLLALPRIIDGAAPAITDLLTFNDDNTIQPKEFTGTTTSQNTFVDPTGLTKIGDLVDAGGLAAAFDGNTSQDTTASARKASTTDGFVGVDHGVGNSETIGFVEAWPSNANGWSDQPTPNVTLTLYGSNTAPSTPSDGTSIQALAAFADDTSKRSFAVTSPSTAYRYHWLRIQQSGSADTMYCAELKLYSYAEAANSYGTNGALLDFADTANFGKDVSENASAGGSLVPQGVFTHSTDAVARPLAWYDGNTSQGSTTGTYVGLPQTLYLRIDYGVGNARPCKGFEAWALTDDGFVQASDTYGLQLQGSNDASVWNNVAALITGTDSAGKYEDASGITITDTTPYRYHQVVLSNETSAARNVAGVAELRFYAGDNDYASNNFTSTDQLADTPTDDADLGIGNFATLNPLTLQANMSASNGNTFLDSSSGDNGCLATLGFSSGKYYWETSIHSGGAGTGVYHVSRGMNFSGKDLKLASDMGNTISTVRRSMCATTSTTNLARYYYNADAATGTISAMDTAADRICCAVDADAQQMWIGHYDATDGVTDWLDVSGGLTGDPAAGSNPTFNNASTGFPSGYHIPLFHTDGTGLTVYFNHSDCLGTIPTGFDNELATQNFPAPTIADPSAHFNTVLYTGNGTAIGSGGNPITGVGFQPDLVWIKNRDQADSHMLAISNRPGKYTKSDSSDAEQIDSESVSTFDSDGFTVGSNVACNTNSENYVAWCWKADGGSTSSNTDGSITTITTNVNTTSGFGYSVYVGNATGGATIGHGLGAVPDFILIKEVSNNTRDWAVYHSSNTSAPETDYLVLNSTAATADDNTYWNDTAPTSSLITLGTKSEVNGSGAGLLAYYWTEVEGFSKFGSYTGNGSTDGPFVYCGFKPAFLMIKRVDSTGSWHIYDKERLGYNPNNNILYADTTNAEISLAQDDLLSNGFKMRNTGAARNASGGTYIYAAFAAEPFDHDGVAQVRAR